MKQAIALLGAGAGTVAALSQLTSAQWHALGATLLALALRYGLVVLPWVLAAVFIGLWWRERKIVDLWRASYASGAYTAPRPQAPRRSSTRRTARR